MDDAKLREELRRLAAQGAGRMYQNFYRRMLGYGTIPDPNVIEIERKNREAGRPWRDWDGFKWHRHPTLIERIRTMLKGNEAPRRDAGGRIGGGLAEVMPED